MSALLNVAYDMCADSILGSFITGNKDGTLAQPGGMILEAEKMGHPIMNVEINYRLGGEARLSLAMNHSH